MLKLSDLQKLGAIPSPEFKKTTITFDSKGEQVSGDIYYREAVPADSEYARKWAQDNDSNMMFALVSRCIRFGENAEEQMTPEQVSGLSNSLYAVLWPIAISGVEEAAKKKSLPTKMSSTASLSSTGSAVKPSRKRSKI